MLLGTTDNPTTGSLRIRKYPDRVKVEGAPPSRHTFPRRFLERELNDAVRINVIVQADPLVTYEVTSITKTGDLNASLIASVEVPSSEEPAPEPKRRWWQRRKNRG